MNRKIAKSWKSMGPPPGQSYTQWFAEKMDGRIEKNPDAFYHPWRLYQLQYLQAQGLTESSDLLDYGCGPCGAGVFMIEFLETGRYIGADISARCIERARDFLQSKGLTEKRPTLVHLQGGDMSVLRGRTFDFIWAQSVLTHMPPDNVRELLREIPNLLRGGGMFLGTFNLSLENRQVGAKNFYYRADFFDEACSAAGLRHSIERDYNHPNDPCTPGREFAVLRIVK